MHTILWDNRELTLREVAVKLNLTEGKVYGTWKKGYRCKDSFLAFRASLEAETEMKVYKTTKGDMNILEVESTFKDLGIKISRQGIYIRVKSWGEKNPDLWLRPGEKRTNTEYIGTGEPPKKRGKPVDITPKKKMNRGKCCYRENFTIRCQHYDLRLEIDDGHPGQCLKATGDSCPNFKGKHLHDGLISKEHMEPYRQLAAEVITRAIKDTADSDRIEASRAKRFLLSSKEDFDFWCQVAGVESDNMRDRLKKRLRC